MCMFGVRAGYFIFYTLHYIHTHARFVLCPRPKQHSAKHKYLRLYRNIARHILQKFDLLLSDIKANRGFFPQHLVEVFLNFRQRVCRWFWLDLAFEDPLRGNGHIIVIFVVPKIKYQCFGIKHNLRHEFSHGTYLESRIEELDWSFRVSQYHVQSSSRMLIRAQTRSLILGP